MIYLLNRLTSVTRSLWLNFWMVLFYRVVVVIELKGGQITLSPCKQSWSWSWKTGMLTKDQISSRNNHGLLITWWYKGSHLIESVEIGQKRWHLIKTSPQKEALSKMVSFWCLQNIKVGRKRWRRVEKDSLIASASLPNQSCCCFTEWFTAPRPPPRRQHGGSRSWCCCCCCCWSLAWSGSKRQRRRSRLWSDSRLRSPGDQKRWLVRVKVGWGDG